MAPTKWHSFDRQGPDFSPKRGGIKPIRRGSRRRSHEGVDQAEIEGQGWDISNLFGLCNLARNGGGNEKSGAEEEAR